MAQVNIRIEGQKELESKLGPKLVKRIRWSTINEGGRAGRTYISRDVREQLAAPAWAVNQAVNLTRSGASDDKGFAEVTVKRKPIPLKYFGPRQTRGGVSVLVRRDQGRRVVQGSFGPRIANLRGRIVRRVGKEPFPIKDLYGQTAVSIAANSPGLIQRVSRRIADTLKARYISKLGYWLSQPG